MYRFYLAAADMLPGAILLIPIYYTLNLFCFKNAKKSILYYLFSCYLCAVYVLVGLPTVTYIRPEINLNLIPLAGMIGDWKNSILNVLLFVPLGFALPVMWMDFRNQKRAVLFGVITSLAIELLQMLTYRATDINDLITNTIGTYLGFLSAGQLLKYRQTAGESSTKDAGIVIATVIPVMFFVYPFASAALWDLILR